MTKVPYEESLRKPTDQTLLDEIVRRIVTAVRPEQIILFGSAARGQAGPNSDLDLLVVVRTDDRRACARRIRRALYGLGVAKDVIVATPADVERHKNNRGMVIYPALREGRVLYAA